MDLQEVHDLLTISPVFYLHEGVYKKLVGAPGLGALFVFLDLFALQRLLSMRNC